MTQIEIGEPAAVTRFPNRWAWFPVGLLGLLVSVQVVLFRLSSGDESFAIEPEYYQKAVNWDAHAREKQASEQLGWETQVAMVPSSGGATLRVSLLDDSGKPVSNAKVSVDTFPNARASGVQHLVLREALPGVYESGLEVTHSGEWEVRVLARSAANTYTKTLRTKPGNSTN